MVTECNFPTAQGRELRALRTLKRETKSPFIFVSERGAPFTVAGLAKLIERARHMPPALSWRTREQTPAHCRPISGTEASNRQCATPSWRRVASKPVALRASTRDVWRLRRAAIRVCHTCGRSKWTLPPCWTGRGWSRANPPMLARWGVFSRIKKDPPGIT
jgi:hypothetical protein